MTSILKVDPDERPNEVKELAWLSDIKWQRVNDKKIPPPWIPEEDEDYFDSNQRY